MAPQAFVSYPKSGRTWVRFLINDYLCRSQGVTLRNVFEAETQLQHVAHIEYSHLSSAMLSRLNYWDVGRLHPTIFDRPWLFLGRDFYQTMVSAYYQATRRIGVFDGTASAFIRDPRFGIVKLVTFYNQWEAIKPAVPGSVTFTYGSMKRDPASTMGHVLRALRLPVDERLLGQTLKAGTFENMKRLGASPEYADTPLAPSDPNNPDAHKVRAGGSDPTEMFTTADLDYIEQVIDALFLHKDDRVYRTLIRRPDRTAEDDGLKLPDGVAVPQPRWMNKPREKARSA